MADNLFGKDIGLLESEKKATKKAKVKKAGYEPPNLGKAVKLPVVDFSDPNRPLTCLEVDFPIAPVNALAQLEATSGAAKKPIYQMSKWWARRQSSVFRSMLIAAALKSPEDKSQAAKLVWDHYYANHQKAGSFKDLKVLDLFMGGGTTMVEGSRLGFDMIGNDLNPIAWFVCRNELSCSDPDTVKAFFDKLEEEVKPLVQPYYTTTCPRGHQGYWIDKETGQQVDVDPLDVPVEQRKRYEWHGPEVIYTFWAKHGPCQAEGCGHRTPIFSNPIIAQKNLSTQLIKTICPECGQEFNIEFGETRIAPGAERIVLDSEPAFKETTQHFGQLLCDYSKGNGSEKSDRVGKLLDLIDKEPGLKCPSCTAFAGQQIKDILERHSRANRVSDINKKHFDIEKKKVQMYLLIHPEWLKGSAGFDKDGNELGGWAGADCADTEKWYKARLEKLDIIEVRGETLPEELTLSDGMVMDTQNTTVPGKSKFACSACGRQKDILDSVRPTEHTAPVAVYTLQCHCPQCDEEGYNYGGRYFKAPEAFDINKLNKSENHWQERKDTDLSDYWPKQECWDAYMMRANGGVNEGWGYTHWWKMFNPRQLLVHTQLLQNIVSLNGQWAIDIKEQALGAWQQYLRSQCMFAFYHLKNDQIAAALSNSNYHPKQQVIETCVFNSTGSGRWGAYVDNVMSGLYWMLSPKEPLSNVNQASISTEDPIIPGSYIKCSSSTDLCDIDSGSRDLVITDPPFGNNVFYADLADFFYVWLRNPLRKLYEELPEAEYFRPERTPHSTEAVDNSVEHPDDREEHERDVYVSDRHLDIIRQLSRDDSIEVNDPNPLYLREPAPEFYKNTLTACWSEACRVLKPGGMMAFTFHHSAYDPWIDVLEALFNSGYILTVTYPIRSDESKGEYASFGSKKIEYDIIHVCRKRIEEPQPVSWAKMRRWVRDEGARLKEMLETSHGTEVPESDLRVILIGKSLEFYSMHYDQVFTGDGELLCVRDALLGIDQLIDDLFAGGEEEGARPPSEAEPASRLFLRIFTGRDSITRDELHKTLLGTGLSQLDLEARGWIRATGTTITPVPVVERFQYFTAPGRKRIVIKTDLDQAYFLTGACLGGSGVNVRNELDSRTFKIKKSCDAVLKWMSEKERDSDVKRAASMALRLVADWRSKPVKDYEPTLFDMIDSEE